MLTDKQKFSKILHLGVEITQVKDLDVLLERILQEARNLANADAGTKRRSRLTVVASRPAV